MNRLDIEDSYEDYEEEYEEDFECGGFEEGYEWTEEDSWDALTDGMYGDMPDGFDGDYSFLGY